MLGLGFALGAIALPKEAFSFAAPLNSPRRRYILSNRPNGIYMKEKSGKGSSNARPLPQGFGNKSSSASDGEKVAFVGNDKLGISFTCDAQGCGERVTKSVKRRSYEKGTVLIRCPKCEKHHIIADNTGMFAHLTGGRKNVEEIAKDTGAAFTRVGTDSFQLDNSYSKFAMP